MAVLLIFYKRHRYHYGVLIPNGLPPLPSLTIKGGACYEQSQSSQKPH